MINVIIVEDEMLVRLGMKLSIESAGMDLKIQGAFSDAETALGFMEYALPNVLITDIRLTGMSGLEMLEQLGKKREKMLMIVLSCYEDFSYARRSYELGVHKYILKHELEEDELAPLIVQLYKEHHLQQPLLSEETQLGLSDFPRTARLDTQFQRHVLSLVDIQKSEHQPDETLNLPMALEVVQEILNHVQGECFLRHREELFCVISFPPETSDDTLRMQTNQIAASVCSTITNYFNRKASFIVSEPFDRLQAIREKYEILKEKLPYGFYAQSTGAVWAESLLPFSKDCPLIALPLQALFTAEWEGKCVAQLRRYFEERKREQTDPRQLKVQSDRFIHALDGMVKANCEIAMEQLLPLEKKINYFVIDHFFHCNDLCNWMIETVVMVRTAVLKNREKDTVATRIVEYVDQNYTLPLTLGEIAECFHLSTVYVCQIFKKKTGVTLINYINRLRIEKAKAYLATGDFSLEQIADKVGIGNVNYFSRLFKLMTGETTGAYKNKIVNKL